MIFVTIIFGVLTATTMVPWMGIVVLTFFERLDNRTAPLGAREWLFLWCWLMFGVLCSGLTYASWTYI